MTKVKNFAGFMKTKSKVKKLNEQDEEGLDAGYYGANPEDEEGDGDASLSDEEYAEEDFEEEDFEEGDEEEEEPTLEDLKAMIDDLEERITALEPEEEEESEEEEEEGEEESEGEEGEEEGEGEEKIDG